MLIARMTIVACLAATLGATPSASAQDASRGTQVVRQDAKGSQNGKSEKPQTGKAKNEALERRRAAIRERIQRERARRRQQTIVRTHVSVRVKLRNGERLKGVVKNGNFVERPSGGLEFVRAEMTQKDAGLRLWYYNKTDGYIFLPYTMIETYKVLKRLTDVEINIIRDEIREQEKLARKAAEARKKRLDEKAENLKQGGAANKKLAKLAKKVAEDEAKAKADAKYLKLVDEFPPSEGWGEQRINQINIRRLTVRVFPNAKERRFIEVFDDWKKGRDLWIEKQKKGAPDAKAKAGTETSKSVTKKGATEPGKTGASKDDSKGASKSAKPGK